MTFSVHRNPSNLRPRPHVSGSFWKRIFFYPFWVPVHTETAFSVTKNKAFRKRSPEWIFLKTPFSCSRGSRVDGWKRSFSKTLTSQHRFMTYQSMRSVPWGSREGILLVCFLLSKFECRIWLSIMEFRYRISNCECHSVFVWTGIFSKTLLVWTRIFLKTDKKRCVFKNIRIRVDGALGAFIMRFAYFSGIWLLNGRGGFNVGPLKRKTSGKMRK